MIGSWQISRMQPVGMCSVGDTPFTVRCYKFKPNTNVRITIVVDDEIIASVHCVDLNRQYDANKHEAL